MSRLSTQGLGVRLSGVPVLTEVDLALEPGQVTAIVGPNGAGKSTLMACLAGLRHPDQGRVLLDGKPVLDFAPRDRARQMGFIPQTPEVAWDVEVRTLVGLGRTPYLGARGLAADDWAAVDRAMAQADVVPFASRIVTTLSGGERARVLIARALAGEPRWLLADEPLAGLDPGHQFDAGDLFRRLAREGAGVVLTLHDLPLAMRIADRVVVLAQGRVIADGPPWVALSPDVLARAYGIEARLTPGAHGPLIEIVGRLA
jgi:iron complex transport system ATP-binding protein